VGGGTRIRNGGRAAVRRAARGGGSQPDPLKLPKASKGGRLTRRSPADVETTLATVVSALKATRGKGMRSEEIQQTLKLDKRELPRVLRHGLAKKALKARGAKRATTYTAA
jgi:hypothetical protein